MSPVEYTILEDRTNTCLFLQFIRMFLEKDTLERGDVFVAVNYSIHSQGDNIGIQEYFFITYGVLIITLLPYHPEFNTT